MVVVWIGGGYLSNVVLRWVIVNLVLTSEGKSCRKKVSVRNSVAQLPESRKAVGLFYVQICQA